MRVFPHSAPGICQGRCCTPPSTRPSMSKYPHILYADLKESFPMQIIPYNMDDDPVIEALRAEGAADPDVIGILVTGSRANGAVTAESDYDVIFIVSDETIARYEREKREPKRGETIDPPIDTS